MNYDVLKVVNCAGVAYRNKRFLKFIVRICICIFSTILTHVRMSYTIKSFVVELTQIFIFIYFSSSNPVCPKDATKLKKEQVSEKRVSHMFATCSINAASLYVNTCSKWSCQISYSYIPVAFLD